MLTDRIIGRVGADILAKRISNPGAAGGFRRAVPARQALVEPDRGGGAGDPGQSRPARPRGSHDPRGFGRGPGPAARDPDPHNAGYVRNNAATAKAAILTANGNEHNLADTLGHVMAIGAKEMRADAGALGRGHAACRRAIARAGRPLGLSCGPRRLASYFRALPRPTRRVLRRNSWGHVHPGLAHPRRRGLRPAARGPAPRQRSLLEHQELRGTSRSLGRRPSPSSTASVRRCSRSFARTASRWILRS